MARQIVSDAQIAGAAKAAGFTGSDVTTVVAIALAESGGNAIAHNPVPPDDSYGLMQINMIGSLGPNRRAEFGLKSNTDLYDPTTNMRVAYAISSGGKHFTPAWSTFTSGAYLVYLSRAQKASGSPADAPSIGSVPGGNAQDANSIIPGSGTLSAVQDFFGTLTDPITWLRLGMMLAGSIAALVGIVLMTGAGSLGNNANLALNFLPGGALAKGMVKGAGAGGVK